MKFVQLKEYDRKIFFLGNHTQNVVEKPFPGSILKKIKMEYISGSLV